MRARVPGGLSGERPPADRAGTGGRDRPRRGGDQRAGARGGHRRARHRGAVRLPGQPSRLLAAGGPGRTARRRGRGDPDRPGQPAGRVPARPPGGALRPAGRGDRAGSGEPVGARSAAGGGRAGAAAAAGRRALVRGPHLGPGRAARPSAGCCAGDPTAGSGPRRSGRSTGSACGAPMRTPSTSSRSPPDGCSARSGWTPPTWWCIPGRSTCTRETAISATTTAGTSRPARSSSGRRGPAT